MGVLKIYNHKFNTEFPIFLNAVNHIIDSYSILNIVQEYSYYAIEIEY